jgi:glycine dehydrogenase
MGFGGPHAAFLATSDAYSRKMPGRLIGVTRDSRGKRALRMALQTREQHIRRDKATSNICTAQALLANMAAAYGVYHGPEGLKAIAHRIHKMAVITADIISQNGYVVNEDVFFDIFIVLVPQGFVLLIVQKVEVAGVNMRLIDESIVGVSFGESINRQDTLLLLSAFGISADTFEAALVGKDVSSVDCRFPVELKRNTSFMSQPVFNSYHSETLMLRYLRSLEVKDISLNFSMIALGSCTMKLNATTEMIPISWPEISNMHPFVPQHQAQGYIEMIDDMNSSLAEITGFAAVSSQPNSGAQGEYAGLLTIKAYHDSRNEHHRNVCLIPTSAHGTNPASAAMCGMKVVVVKSDEKGNVDVDDLRKKADKHKDNLAALMITYPSTYGVFESRIKEIIEIAHTNGGLVYMDGANMNAQIGFTSPGYIGADVCHLNLHKSFCIPHGGGGPGVGSIGVAARLAPFLPGHCVVPTGGTGSGVICKTESAIAGAPYGSASILPITWMYLKLLGGTGLKDATSSAILHANYMAKVLSEKFKIAFTGKNGQCAHEFIVDLRMYKDHDIVEEDVAKRLQDYGFHSPTMSWPVAGTLMIEPTESEDKAEMDRFCQAMFLIHAEIQDVVQGRIAAEDSPLKHAPHTMDMISSSVWDRKYSRETAAFPAPWTTASKKFWPTVGRVDNVYGDRNLVCSCPPLSAWDDEIHEE